MVISPGGPKAVLLRKTENIFPSNMTLVFLRTVLLFVLIVV